MKNYIISEEVLKGIVDYLKGRPYAEVAIGMEILLKLEEVKEPAKVELVQPQDS